MTQEQMNELAKYLRLETLETRHNDELDFPTISVWTLREALEKAYQAGKNSK